EAVRSTDRSAARSLVLEGEPGIGKTTLWTEAIDRARRLGFRTLTCRPSLSEAALSYVGVFDLLDPVADAALPDLPPPQRLALEVVLRRAEAGEREVDPLAAGIGLTALLHEIARGQPVLLAVGDGPWLDAAAAPAPARALR